METPSHEELTGYLDFARQAVRSAAEAIEALGSIDINYKQQRDLVTNADLASERLLVELIGRRFRGHGIIAEEAGIAADSATGWRWLLDPLDGTTNFSRGYPDWTVSLALTYNWQPLVGVVYFVSSGQLFWAVKGGGAFAGDGDRPLRVSATPALAGALVATGFPYSCDQPQALFDRLRDVFLAGVNDIKRKGPASAETVYVASGILDAYYEGDLKPWDVAAAMLIAREAGARVSDWQGRELDLRASRIEIAVSNGRLHRQLLEIIQRY